MAKMIGQGTPLPADLGCNGEWIVEEFLFLYHGENRFGRPSRFEITIGARYNGNDCIGFHAAQIALMFKVDEATIVAANKSGDLALVGHVADTGRAVDLLRQPLQLCQPS